VKFIQNFKIIHQLGYIIKGIGPDLLGPDVFKNYLSLLRVVPELGLLGY
jgi:hypothetical protein